MGTPELTIDEAVSLLERTPRTVRTMLEGIPRELARATEGDGTWSPYDVVGHLIHGERTDWIPRARHIMAGEIRPFEPFDRQAQFSTSGGASLDELLDQFTALRDGSIAALRGLGVTDDDLGRKGLHPELGEVTLGQLLATWVVHDLDHVVQIARTIAKTQTTNVGPWSVYLGVLKDRT